MNFFNLPRKFWWSHHLSFLLHDHLACVVSQGEEKDLFWVKVPARNENEAISLQALGPGDDIIEWLRTHGRAEESLQVFERVIVHGLLADMCQFLFEAIECAAKGKMGVAFALLRKPFRDQLFILEWLLVEREGFLSQFENGPKALDLYRLLKEKKDWTRSIVERAMAKSHSSAIGEHEFLWEMRFEKSVHWTLDGLWNQALHLVTTDKNYSTEPGNLNFAFIQEEDRDDLRERFYRHVPFVLVHMCGVVRSIIAKWNANFISMGRLFDLRVAANLELALRETCHEESIDSFGIEAINEFLLELKIPCENCEAQLQIRTLRDLEIFARDIMVPCCNCGLVDERFADFDARDDESDDCK